MESDWCSSGFTNGNTSVNALAKLKGVGGHYWTTPVLATAAAAHGYRLQFLEITARPTRLGRSGRTRSNSAAQTSLAAVPYDIVLDRVFIHGHPTKGQKRCVSLNGVVEILNSYISNWPASTTTTGDCRVQWSGPVPHHQ
jgi:hypothetical protein